jgi:hypothetical protein
MAGGPVSDRRLKVIADKDGRIVFAHVPQGRSKGKGAPTDITVSVPEGHEMLDVAMPDGLFESDEPKTDLADYVISRELGEPSLKRRNKAD